MPLWELADLRVAVVHHWLVHVRGGEKTFFELARAIPHADVFFIHYEPSRVPPDLASRVPRASFLQHVPRREQLYRWFLPALPLAAYSLDLRDYDLVVSSSSGWAHAVRTAPAARHVCYMHSPPRYLWGEPAPTRLGRALTQLGSPVFGGLRAWDSRRARSVNQFVANSRLSARRVQRAYGAPAVVIHPPVDTERFARIGPSRSGYLLAVGEMVPYKRFDLAVQAAVKAGIRLVLVGDGPERASLEMLAANRDVHFAGRVNDAELLRLMSGASALIHPGIEDFGIVMAEGLAAGIPVIAHAAGGAAEIVTEETGVLVPEMIVDAYVEAINSLQSHRDEFQPAVLRQHAQRFSIDRFRSDMVKVATETVQRAPRPLPRRMSTP